MNNNLNFIVDSMDTKGCTPESIQDAQTNILKNLEKNYDEIEENDGWVKTKKNGKYGVIFNGKVSCNCVYDEIDDKGSSLPFLKVKQGEKYGLINVQGEKLLDLEYDDLTPYKEGYVGVKKGDKRGLRHATKPYQTECIYDKISYRYGDYFYVSVDGKMGALNKKGELIINPQFQDVDEYGIPNIIGAKRIEDGKMAIFDEDGNQISDFIYDRIDLNKMDEIKEEGKLKHMKKEMLVMTKGKYKGILNKDGEFLPAEYDDFCDKWTEGLLPAKKDGKWGVVNEKGEKIVDFVYDKIQSFLGGLAVVELNGKQGLINNKGEVILKPELDNVRNLGEGIGGIKENGKLWFINDKGEKLKKIEYNSVSEFKEGLVPVQLGGKWGFLDKDLNLICDFKYDGVGYFKNGRAAVKNGDKYGFIDKNGNEICDIKYENVKLFNEGRSIVERDGKCGVIDMEGNEIYFGLEGCLMDFSGGLAAAWEIIDNKKNKSFFVDKNGKEIGKDRGYSVTVSINGAATAHKNGQDILLNEQGEEIDKDRQLKSEWFNI